MSDESVIAAALDKVDEALKEFVDAEVFLDGTVSGRGYFDVRLVAAWLRS